MAAIGYLRRIGKAAGALLAMAFLVVAVLGGTAASAYADTAAMAVYDSETHTLAFYGPTVAATYEPTSSQTVYPSYDQQEQQQEGEQQADSQAPWEGVRASIAAIVASDPEAPVYADLSGYPALEAADLTGWDLSAGDEAISLARDFSLSRIAVGAGTRIEQGSLPEHPTRGAIGQDWTLENGNGDQYTTSNLVRLVNGGNGAGTWVWAPLTARQLAAYPHVEERVYDEIDRAYRVATDAYAGQDLIHKVAATLPPSLTQYETEGLPVSIETQMAGITISSLDDVAVDIDGTDITTEVRTGGYGSIAWQDSRLTVSISDVLSDFGKGVAATNQSVISVSYKAHTTALTPLGATSGSTTSKMTYASPPTRATEAPSETSPATTLTASYALVIAKTDRLTGEPLQGARLTVYSQALGKYVQADGSLGDTPCELTTQQDGTVRIQHIGRGAYLIHETQPAEGHEAATDATITLDPTYADSPASLTGLSATAAGDAITQPVDGQQAVADGQDGITGIDAASGTVAIRLSSPAAAQPQPTRGDPVATPALRGGNTGPTTISLEIQKVDKQTRQPVQYAGYKVATSLNNATAYLRSDGTWTAAVAEAGIFTTDQNGAFTLQGLAEGAYSFHEATHPNHYSTDAPDFVVNLAATRDANTNEITAITATYSGGYTDVNHSGAGLAGANEDGVVEVVAENGSVRVRSSMAYVLSMPRAGIAYSPEQIPLVIAAVNYVLMLALFAARRAQLDAYEVRSE